MRELGWDELTAFLDTAVFTGLLFEGQLLDVDGIRRFYPMSTPVYLETATSLLKLDRRELRQRALQRGGRFDVGVLR